MPLQKNMSQLGILFPIYGEIKNVPNHQPDPLCVLCFCLWSTDTIEFLSIQCVLCARFLFFNQMIVERNSYSTRSHARSRHSKLDLLDLTTDLPNSADKTILARTRDMPSAHSLSSFVRPLETISIPLPEPGKISVAGQRLQGNVERKRRLESPMKNLSQTGKHCTTLL